MTTQGVAPEHAQDDLAAVLVPLDGSELSIRTLPVAHSLALRIGGDVVLLSAVDSEDEVAEREAELAGIELLGVQVRRSVVVDRDPAGAIHNALKALGAAVACMASHGRGRTAALIGSVATEVVARGHDPVVVVGPLVGERRMGAGVLACVDDSPASHALLPVGIRWARLLGEPLTVLTVAEPVPPPLDERPARRAFGPDGDVEAFLEAVVGLVRQEAPDVPVATAAVYDPISPAEGVAVYLDEHPAHLLVVSSHARSGLARVVFGSVAADIVHRSPFPVLVVPRPDAR
jgi:nucleotide-binding universal stress UspA family protein